MGKLDLYVSREAQPQLLKEGDNVVYIKSFCECTTFDDVRAGSDGNLHVAGQKEDLPEWKNSIDQFAFHLIGEQGSLVYKQALTGVKSYSQDLTDEERESGLFVEKGTYACTMVNGRLERVEHAGHTQTCKDKIESFLFAVANGNKDLKGQALIDSAIANKSKFIVKVKKEPWRNPVTGELTVQMVADSFRPISKAKPAPANSSEIPTSLQA